MWQSCRSYPLHISIADDQTATGRILLKEYIYFSHFVSLWFHRSIGDLNSASVCCTSSGMESSKNHSSETLCQNSRNIAHGFHSLELSCSHPRCVNKMQEQLPLRLTSFFKFGLKNYIRFQTSSGKNLFQYQIYGTGEFSSNYFLRKRKLCLT